MFYGTILYWAFLACALIFSFYNGEYGVAMLSLALIYHEAEKAEKNRLLERNKRV